MRILQVSHHYFPSLGGVERHLQNISETLVGLGHEVIVATVKANTKASENEVINGVIIKRFSAIGPAAFQVPIGLLKYLLRERDQFDIIHAHNYHTLPFMITLLAVKKCFISPYYHEISHSKIADLLHYLYAPIMKQVIKLAKPKGIHLSEGEARAFQTKFDIPEKDVMIVPSGVTLPKANSTHTKKAGMILSVGRLAGYKKIDKLILTMAHLPDKFSLTIIGSGQQRGYLEQLSKHLNLDTRVNFLGRIESDQEVAKYYSQSQVFVSLSEVESFGITILEAVSYHCKIVCSDIPSFLELAKDFPDSISTNPLNAPPEVIAQEIEKAAGSQECSNSNLEKYLWPQIILNIQTAYYNHLQNDGSDQKLRKE